MSTSYLSDPVSQQDESEAPGSSAPDQYLEDKKYSHNGTLRCQDVQTDTKSTLPRLSGRILHATVQAKQLLKLIPSSYDVVYIRFKASETDLGAQCKTMLQKLGSHREISGSFRDLMAVEKLIIEFTLHQHNACVVAMFEHAHSSVQEAFAAICDQLAFSQRRGKFKGCLVFTGTSKRLSQALHSSSAPMYGRASRVDCA